MIIKTGIEKITEERNRQIKELGYDGNYDFKNNFSSQLTQVVGVLITDMPEEFMEAFIEYQSAYPPDGWDRDYWSRLVRKPFKERLVIAGALIAAEIDRLLTKDNTFVLEALNSNAINKQKIDQEVPENSKYGY